MKTTRVFYPAQKYVYADGEGTRLKRPSIFSVLGEINFLQWPRCDNFFMNKELEKTVKGNSNIIICSFLDRNDLIVSHSYANFSFMGIGGLALA